MGGCASAHVCIHDLCIPVPFFSVGNKSAHSVGSRCSSLFLCFLYEWSPFAAASRSRAVRGGQERGFHHPVLEASTSEPKESVPQLMI